MSIFRRKKKEDSVKSRLDRDHAVQKDQIEKSEEVKIDKKETRNPEKLRNGTGKKQETRDINKNKVSGKFYSQSYKHLIRPVTSEKASDLGIYNQYIFEVAPNSNKIEIKKAIKDLYGVKPIKINILNMRGKNVRYGKNAGKLKNWKKAVVILRAGDKIDVYEGV